MLKTAEKVIGLLGLALIVLIIYGLATDCKDVVGYHKDRGGRSCEIR
jgi:hypothetical protein